MKDGKALGKKPKVKRDDVMRLTAKGFTPGEKVKVEFDDDSDDDSKPSSKATSSAARFAVVSAASPKTIATLTAAKDGSVAYNFTVPATVTNGPAAVTFSGAKMKRTFDFTVVAAGSTTTADPAVQGVAASTGGSLPRTGADSMFLVGGAFLLLMLGMGSVLTARLLRPVGGKHV